MRVDPSCAEEVNLNKFLVLKLRPGRHRSLRPPTYRLLVNGPLVPRLDSVWTVPIEAARVYTLRAQCLVR